METSQMPRISYKYFEHLVEKLYGIRTLKYKLFDGYDDLNFWLISTEKFLSTRNNDNDNSTTTENGLATRELLNMEESQRDQFVLKVTNERNSMMDGFTDAQISLLSFLGAQGMRCPDPIPDIHGRLCSLQIIEYGPNGQEPGQEPEQPHKHIVALCKYVPGRLMGNLKPIGADHFRQAGEILAKFHEVASTFTHPYYSNGVKPKWSLHQIRMVEHFIDILPDETKRQRVQFVLKQFNEQMNQIKGGEMPEGIIHGDFNTMNILATKNEQNNDDDDSSSTYEVSAFLDVGDSHYGLLIFDLATAVCYMLLEESLMDFSAIQAGKYFIEGYTQIRQLNEQEKCICAFAVCARLCQSMTYGYHAWILKPTKDNEYVLMTNKNGWSVLDMLLNLGFAELEKQWFRS